jgi:hypothetical protein
MLPDGKRAGPEWIARNPKRADNSAGSFSINLLTGKWADFATGDAGGDIISLSAYLRDTNQPDAAAALAVELGIASVAGLATVAGHTERIAPTWRPIIPAPEGAPDLSRDFVAGYMKGFEWTGSAHYFDQSGLFLGTVARYDPISGGHFQKKEFRSFVFCESDDGKREWRAMGFPVPRPLYRLHDLAARPTAPVLIVEGEKAADAASTIFPDFVVMTSPNGAQSPHKANWSPLSGRKVVIWPDHDEPGARYAAVVNEMVIAAGATSVRIVTLPAGLPVGWDLADPLPAHLSSDDILKCLIAAKAHRADAPLPLFPPLPPAERFPIEALGPTLSRAAAAIARKVQAPEAIAGQSVLAAAALAAQAHADVLLPYGQARPLSLFFVTVASSGDRKSTADNEALWPIAKHERWLREEHKRDIVSWKIAHAAWSAERKKIEADKKYDFDQRVILLEALGEEPPRLLEPFLKSGDLTIEGLTKNWPNLHAALGVFTAEAGQFTSGHGMSDDNRLKTAAMLSELWDGKPVTRVRATDGVTILPGRRLSLHLMVQPDAAATFLGNATLRDQGLLSRVLVAAPGSMAGTRLYRDVDPRDEAAIQAYGARILSMLETAPRLAAGTRNELDPRELPLSDQAAGLWRRFHDHVEGQCGNAEELSPIVDFAAKAAEHAARIAAVLTMVENLHATEVGSETMGAATTLADWYLAEALRLQRGARTNPKLVAADTLLTWLQARGTLDVEFRDILQLGPSPFRTKQAAEETIAVLAAHGWITETSARPRRFRIAPPEA